MLNNFNFRHILGNHTSINLNKNIKIIIILNLKIKIKLMKIKVVTFYYVLIKKYKI